MMMMSERISGGKRGDCYRECSVETQEKGRGVGVEDERGGAGGGVWKSCMGRRYEDAVGLG